MSLSSSLTDLLNKFNLGTLAITMSYKIDMKGNIDVQTLSFHEPYEWNGKKDPPYISLNTEKKTLNVSNLTSADLKDKAIQQFTGLNEAFGE